MLSKNRNNIFYSHRKFHHQIILEEKKKYYHIIAYQISEKDSILVTNFLIYKW